MPIPPRTKNFVLILKSSMCTAIFNCSFLQISCSVQCRSLTGAKTNYSLHLPTISLIRSANWESASADIFTWELLFEISPDACLTSEISLSISSLAGLILICPHETARRPKTSRPVPYRFHLMPYSLSCHYTHHRSGLHPYPVYAQKNEDRLH